MQAGNLIYKCRLCGAQYEPIHTPDVLKTISEIVVYGKSKSFFGLSAKMTDIHNCEDSRIGVSDLIGAVNK